MSVKNSYKPKVSASGVPLSGPVSDAVSPPVSPPVSGPVSRTSRYTDAQLAAMLVDPKPVSDRARKIFLRCLSITGDIVAAAQAAGQDDVDFFELRQCSVGFSAEWDAAIHVAHIRLKSLLLGTTIEFASKPLADADPRIMAVLHRLALNLLSGHRKASEQMQQPVHNKPSTVREEFLATLVKIRAKSDAKLEAEAKKNAANKITNQAYNG